jgi:N-acetylmuramoyl-L-alanine amidase
MSRFSVLLFSILVLVSVACQSAETTRASPQGEIIVNGEAIPIAAPVVNWRNAGGYDAQTEHCWFEPERVLPSAPAPGCETPRRYSARSTRGLDEATAARVEREGWSRETLAARLQHFVLHYDVCVSSHRCFRVLHDQRGLSVHFLLDVDGTIYQTLDLVHRARHAGWVNDRSVGIEIAHIGAYPADNPAWRKYYVEDQEGLRLRAPESFSVPEGDWRPARAGVFKGVINGAELEMVDYTEEQYRSLAALVDWLATEFPRLAKRVPRDDQGEVATDEMTRRELEAFEGIIGHNHVTKRKSDPGPAMDWDRLLR